MKKKLIIFAFIMLVLLYISDFNLISLVPTTNEHHIRVNSNRYKKCKKHFDALVSELDEELKEIDMQFQPNAEYQSIRLFTNNSDWTIYVRDESDDIIYEYSKEIENTDAIDKIEECFKDELIGVIYRVDKDGYDFRIGESGVKLQITEDGATVKDKY